MHPRNGLRDKYLLWNFAQELHTAEQVAAPQHEAPKVISYKLVSKSGKATTRSRGQLTVPRLGTAKSGRESKAPIVSTEMSSSTCKFEVDDGTAEVFEDTGVLMQPVGRAGVRVGSKNRGLA